MTQLVNAMERHILKHAGTEDWAEVPVRYWQPHPPPSDMGHWVAHVGLKPAVRRLVRLGYIHARTANYSPIGNHAERHQSPEEYPNFSLVQTQAMLTQQGMDLVTLVIT